MKRLRFNHQILLLILLAFVSGCNDIGTAKFDEVASGTGSSQDGGTGGNNPTPTPPGSTFAGLTSVGNKTDSTATLYWTPHSDAVNYLVYDTTSGSPVLLQTISNPTANSLTLTGLTADATYKFRVRMENASSEIDSNTTELSVTMNHAPEVPTTPAFHTPATSPGTVNKPTLTVNGVKAGDIVKIFTDNCSTEVASGTVASGQTSINLQVSNNLSANTYFFYANSTNAQGHSSNCTSSFLTYVLTFSFNGLTVATNKTDSTVTLNWSTHPNALSYVLYDVTSGTAVYKQTISNPATNSLNLTGLTPDASYKFRLKMIHNADVVDTNTNDLTVVMNHAPATPNTPTYNTPASSPGTNNKPTFTVSGVKAGDVIRLYKDNATCNSTAVASGTVGASQTSIDLQLSSALTLDGTYVFYADAANSANHRSNCTAGISYELIQPTCPTGYIQMAANASLGVNNDFCVAEYEMRCTGNTNGQSCSGNAVSKAEGTPWVNISATNAWNTCLALNSEANTANRLADTNNDGTYALISNPEWMTVARSIEDETTNWVGGVINRGWSANTSYNDGWTHSAVAAQTDASCLYSSNANTCASTGLHKFKRTHKLKNSSSEIWDFSGNVYEWTDWDATRNSDGSTPKTTFALGPRGCTSSWTELNVFNPNSCTTGFTMSADDYMPIITTNTSTQNIGPIYGGSGGAALRGGFWADGSRSGPFALLLSNAASAANTLFGFRCVFRP